MNLSQRLTLKAEARRRLGQASYSPHGLMLIYAGVNALFFLTLTLLNYLIQGQIDQTGGLGGMGTRAVLSTLQSFFQLAGTVLLPFWTLGVTHCAMKLARGQEAQPRDLLEGFRRFFPMLRLRLLRTLIYTALITVSIYLAFALFLLTPMSDGLLAITDSLVSDTGIVDTAMMEDPTVMAALSDASLPLMLLFLGVLALLAIPRVYKLRFAEYLLLDGSQNSALLALRESSRMLSRNRLALFRLDLSFWWFYLLDGLALVLCYADVLLPLFGISLPLSPQVRSLVSYAAYLLIQMLLYWRCKAQVETTYALAYDSLRSPN